MSLKLEDLITFQTVAELLSVTDAAAHLGVPKSTISRRIALVEEYVGAHLFKRTTRKVRLTEAGDIFLETCEGALGLLDGAQSAISEAQRQPAGELNVVMPVEIGVYLLGEIIGKFIEQYPRIVLDLEMQNRSVDLLNENVDLWIRITPMEISGMISRKLGQLERRIVASPSYLEKYGFPKRLEDIEQHRCVLLRRRGRLENRWSTETDGVRCDLHVSGRVVVNNVSTANRAVASGAGIGWIPAFLSEPMISDGRLVHLFPDTSGFVEVYACYASRIYMPSKVRVFIDFLVENAVKTKLLHITHQ